jgi:hypothetical protein
MALVIILGAFYLVIRATLDNLVCPAHNCCPFHPVVSYSIPLVFCLTNSVQKFMCPLPR